MPADARLLDARGVEVDESTLTGESLPVEKDTAPLPEDTPLADRRSMVFAGTGMTRGRARAVVTSTGMGTELGLIAQLAGTAVPPPTPLQARLGRLARLLAAAGVGLTLALGAAMLARGSSLHEAFLTGVSVAVAAVPEGLLATVTIALALGAGEMAARGAIVRRLAAIETIGGTTTACVDKTGTLTENRMRVAAVRPATGREAAEVLAAAALASSAELVDDDGTLRVVGDPVEGAVLLAALEQGLSRRRLVENRELVAELPFSPERRRMTVVYDEPDGRRMFVKGAPEVLLELTDGHIEASTSSSPLRRRGPRRGSGCSPWRSGASLRTTASTRRPSVTSCPSGSSRCTTRCATGPPRPSGPRPAPGSGWRC